MSGAGIAQRVLRRAMRGFFGLPQPLLRRLAGAPVRSDGHELDPELQLLLAMAPYFGPPIERLPPAAARRSADRNLGLLDATPRPMASVRDTVAGGVPIRVYRPHALPQPAPLLVWYHGGGSVIGNLDSHDALCRALAAGAGCAVASVDYRLAPEHPYPCALDDARAAHAAVAGATPGGAEPAGPGIDRTRIAVGGDSFGGNLAAVIARTAASRGVPPPRAQLLVYPWLDLAMSHPSIETFRDGYLLTASLRQWFFASYRATATDPDASPFAATDAALVGAPPALIYTAGFDPLRDEGHAYANRLVRAAVPTRYHCFSPLIHGFAQMTGAIGGARAAVATIARDLRDALAPIHH